MKDIYCINTLREIQVILLVLVVNLPFNILCPLKELNVKQSMLENLTLYIQGECI